MSDLRKTLYASAQEKRVPRYLNAPEYRRAVAGLEEGWDDFRSALTGEQERQLDGLLAKEDAVWRLESQAVFCAGVSIGLGLGRL